MTISIFLQAARRKTASSWTPTTYVSSLGSLVSYELVQEIKINLTRIVVIYKTSVASIKVISSSFSIMFLNIYYVNTNWALKSAKGLLVVLSPDRSKELLVRNVISDRQNRGLQIGHTKLDKSVISYPMH